MKKAIRLLMAVVMLLSIIWVGKPEVMLAAPSLSMSTTASTVIIGKEVKVTVSVPSGYGATVDLKFDQNLFEYVSASTAEIGTTNLTNGYLTVNLTSILNAPSVTITFKAKSSGTATFQATPVFAANEDTEEQVQMNGASATVTVANEVVPDNPKSDDNSLSSLKLSANGTAISLSPAFKYNVINYTATVEHSVSKVVVSATKSDSKATIVSITGNGNVSLNVGSNTIEIVVQAENGYKVTYRIVVTRKAQPASTEDTGTTPPPSTDTEDVPTIEGMDSGWNHNGSTLYFTEKIPSDSIPSGFSKSQMMIKNQEVPCLGYKTTDLTLFYLKNGNGNGSLYVYDKTDNVVYPFVRLTSNDRFIMILEPNVSDAVEGFDSCTLSIEGKGMVTAYRANESDFYLIYAMNNEGVTGWYQYDNQEGTFQRYAGNLFEGSQPGEDTEINTEDDTQAGNVPGETENNTENNSENNTENNKVPADVEDLQLQLAAAKDQLMKLMCIFAFIMVVFVVVIINLLITRKRVEVEDIIPEEEEDFEEDFEEEEAEAETEGSEDAEELAESAESEESVESTESTESTDATLDLEAAICAQEEPPTEKAWADDIPEEENDQDLEFIDL